MREPQTVAYMTRMLSAPKLALACLFLPTSGGLSCDRRSAGLGAAALLLRPACATAAAPRLPLEVGFGTCCDLEPGAVDAALEVGFRTIDTAAHYGKSEASIGDAVGRAVRRGLLASANDVRVITKIWFDDMTYAGARESIAASRAALRRDTLDVALIHFPGANDAVQDPKRNREARAETWRALEDARAAGEVGAIGVSNFARRHLKEAFATWRTPPEVLALRDGESGRI